MDILKTVGHLQRELGDGLFAALIDPANTGKVREFAQKLAEDALSTEMTIGSVTYEILSFHEGDEKSVGGSVMVERAKKLDANQGKSERERLLANQADIPIALRGKVVFVFTDDRHPDNPENVCCVCWSGGRWVERWLWLGRGWLRSCRVLRRK